MTDHDVPAGDLPRLRRGAHQFLRQRVALAWTFQHDGDRWEMTPPPDAAALPERRRYRAHARQEARPLAMAQLYDLDPEITAHVVCLGNTIHESGHGEAIARAGHPHVAATMGIQPPPETGFVRWRDGIGCNALGARVVACHWAPWGPPSTGGRWMAWWADSRAMAAAYAAYAAYAAQIQAHDEHIGSGTLAEAFGPLWYGHQDLLLPVNGSAPGTVGGQRPEPDAGETPDGQAGTPGLVLFDTTLATWHLLARLDGGIQQGLNDPELWGPQAPRWRRAHRVLWQHGPQQAGPSVPDTRALNCLIGWRDPERQRRADGIGFCDAAGLAGDYTPAQVPVPQGWQRRAIDRIRVSKPWKDAIVPGSSQVHQPADPASPDSGHLRVSVAAGA